MDLSDATQSLGKSTSHLPLVVDLDGTLVLCDTSVKTSVWLMKHQPHIFFKLLPLCVVKRSLYKSLITNYYIPDPKTLPWSSVVLRYLKEEKQKGRELYLATGTNEKIASRIAEYLGVFNEIFASSVTLNLTGKNKAKILCEKFGEKKFVYAGNAWIDTHVWEKSDAAVVCHAPHKLVMYAKKHFDVEKVLP